MLLPDRRLKVLLSRHRAMLARSGTVRDWREWIMWAIVACIALGCVALLAFGMG